MNDHVLTSSRCPNKKIVNKMHGKITRWIHYIDLNLFVNIHTFQSVLEDFNSESDNARVEL